MRHFEISLTLVSLIFFEDMALESCEGGELFDQITRVSFNLDQLIAYASASDFSMRNISFSHSTSCCAVYHYIVYSVLFFKFHYRSDFLC